MENTLISKPLKNVNTKNEKYILRINSPVSTDLANASARSIATLPSVFLIVGSPPCCNKTTKNKVFFS